MNSSHSNLATKMRQDTEGNHEYLFKIVITGDANTGKTKVLQ